jgi:hypothetical protein
MSAPSYLVAHVVLKQQNVMLSSGNMAETERLIGNELCQQK